MKKPEQSKRFDAATQQMKLMAGKYGRYPWNFCDAQMEYLRAMTTQLNAPADLVLAIVEYDQALTGWRQWEQARTEAQGNE